MNRYIVLMMIFLSFSAHADYLEILFQQHDDVAAILPAIHANEERSVEELYKIQKRALLVYRDAKAYEQILSEGLNSNNEEYRRSTCRLIIDTFKMYLTFNPEISDVAKLVTAKDAFSEREFIQLVKTCLHVYKSADDYMIFFKVLRGLTSNYQESSFLMMFFNKKPTIDNPGNWYEKLLNETYQDFMRISPKPRLIDVIEFIDKSKRFDIDNSLIKLQEMTYDAYPQAASLPLIAKIGLSSDKESVRKESLDLAVNSFIKGFCKEPNNTEWIMSFFSLINSVSRDIFAVKLAEIRDQLAFIIFYKRNIDEILILISSIEKGHREFAVFFRELLLELGPDSKIKSLKDCEMMPPELIGRCKSTFLMNNEVNLKLPIKDIYQILAILRENNLSNNDKYRLYQKQLDILVMVRINDELKTYFGEENNLSSKDTSTINIPVASTCYICLSVLDAEESLILKNCQHLICKYCFKEYILSQFHEGVKEMRCFERNCAKLISPQDIAEGGLSDIENLINGNILLSKVSRIPGAFFCRNEYCPDAFIPSLINKQPQKSSHICRTCNYAQCRKCANSHAGMSCRKFAAKVKKSKADEKRLIKGKNLKYKPCPKCQVIIEKNEGCDHMTCKSCHYEFWWSTLKEYKKP